MSWETVIGIEIHCELSTKTKMFSSSPVAFGERANTCANAIDLGHPGTLPSVNRDAVRLAILAGTAFECEIHPYMTFDRKNYYYADLPKGYQITQQFDPIATNGVVRLSDGKEVRMERIHLEEDTAKQFHSKLGTLVDFNRAGTPLIEIVSAPDMRNAKEAADYVEKIRSTLLYLGVSDVKMEEGSMRCDVNISLRKEGSEEFGRKVEIKNLNSISNVQKAIESEEIRQAALLEAGETIEQSTRRYDETQKSTVLMRLKEGDVDYKFFPDPNIPPIMLDLDWVKEVQETMEELPDARIARYMSDYELSDYDANVLVQTKELAYFFDEVVAIQNDYKKVANWLIVELVAALNKANLKWKDNPISAQGISDLISMINSNEISSKQAKVVFEDMMEGKSPKDIVKERGMEQLSDTSALEQLIKDALDNNPQSIEDYKNGKDRAVGFLVGQVMKASKGTANPAMTSQMITEELKKR